MSRLSAPQQSFRSPSKERLVAAGEQTIEQTASASLQKGKPNFAIKCMRNRVLRWLGTIHKDQITFCDGDVRVICGEKNVPELSTNLHISNHRFYWHLLTGGTLGAAEAYLRGYWRAQSLVTLMRILCRQEQSVGQVGKSFFDLLYKPGNTIANYIRRNSKAGSRRNIAAHYDLSNEFFAMFLDPTMTYSSGIFPSANSTMEEASLAKYERICRKLSLSADDHLLEIGTGWGGFAIYAAKHYGCQITTTTISAEQHKMAEQRVREAGLSDKITILQCDYRDLKGSYDKLTSIEMVEAVGHAYLPNYFEQCCRLLKPDGIFVMQAITIPDQRYENYRRGIDFIQRYIFPGGCLPSLGAIQSAITGKTDFQLVHLEDFAGHYARTLANWHERFKEREAEIRNLGMDSRFIRAWEYYFAYCQAGFEERQVGVAQLVFCRSQSRAGSLLETLTKPSSEIAPNKRSD